MGIEHLADGDDVREQTGAGRNSSHGQVGGRAGSLNEGAGQHEHCEQHCDETFLHDENPFQYFNALGHRLQVLVIIFQFFTAS